MSSVVPSDSSSQLLESTAESGDGGLHLHSLTGLRFYAAFSVFFGHLYHFNYFGLNNPLLMQMISCLGYLGVSIFYVLSGFVMFFRYYAKEHRKLSIKDFYIARFARVYPAFILMTFLAIPIELFSSRKSDFLINLVKNITVTHCYTKDSCISFNDVGWSISVEALFYILFPLFLIAFYKPRDIFLLFLGVITLMFGLNILFSDSFYASNYFPLNRVLEFTSGMLMGWIYYHPKVYNSKGFFGQGLPRYTLPWLIGAMIVTLFALPLFFTPIGLREWSHLFYVLPASALILMLALAEREKLSFPLFSTSLVVFGGEISYSFYLVHNLIMRYFSHGLRIAFDFDVATTSPILQIVLAGLCLLGSVFLAILLYRFIEKPYRKKIRQLFAYTENRQK